MLDFNLWLSPRDVWTGQINDNGTGGTLTTTDRSCTAPQVSGSYAGVAASPFLNSYYAGLVSGVPGDSGGTSLDRTREGYVEIIEMGVLANGVDAASSPSTPQGHYIAAKSSMAPTESPEPPLAPRYKLMACSSTAATSSSLVGGLTGNGIIINSGSGTEFAYTPVALSNSFNSALPMRFTLIRATSPPTLNNASPARSDVFVATAGTPTVLTVLDWTVAPALGTGIDAVSAALMRSSIINEYDISPNFKTDWVVTQPTKRAYVFPVAAPAIGPFANLFTGTSPNATACDPVLVTGYDREEAPYFQQSGITFSPAPAGSVSGFGNICYEATVITIAPSGTAAPAVNTASPNGIFGSVNTGFIAMPANGVGTPVAPNYIAGWIGLYPTASVAAPAGNNHPGQFMSGGGSGAVVTTLLASGGLRGALQVHTDAVARRYRGLPVIGFQATQAILWSGLRRYFRPQVQPDCLCTLRLIALELRGVLCIPRFFLYAARRVAFKASMTR